MIDGHEMSGKLGQSDTCTGVGDMGTYLFRGRLCRLIRFLLDPLGGRCLLARGGDLDIWLGFDFTVTLTASTGCLIALNLSPYCDWDIQRC